MNKIVKNITWLIFDKVFILFLQFLVGVKIANYYGTDIYGNYAYIGAIIAFSSFFFELINGRVVKKYYTKDNYSKIVYNLTFFKSTIAIFLLICSIGIKIFINIDKISYIILIFLALDNVFLTMTMGIENYYEYKLEVKKIVISNNVVKIFSYALQYIGILLNYSIVIIPIVRSIGSLLRMFILKNSYKKNYKTEKINLVDIKVIFLMIKDSFYLWASFVAFLIYTQIDKIMLGTILGKKEVGIYSVGIQLANILAIIINPIQTILFTKMLELYKESYKKYIEFYLKANFTITQIYLLGAIFSIFVVRNIFNYIFSIEYSGAISIYEILIISIIVKANGALQTGHLTIKDITKKIFYKTFVGVWINIFLNYILIKKYGIIGAAFSTSITQIFTLFIIDFFIVEYREHALIQLKSFNPFLVFKILKNNKEKQNV